MSRNSVPVLVDVRISELNRVTTIRYANVTSLDFESPPEEGVLDDD
jgi:hypothetical protein